MLFGFIERLVIAARISACVAVLLIGAFLGSRWSLAQSSGKPAGQQKAAHSNVAVEELAAFVTHLQDTGQTNALRLFNDYARDYCKQHQLKTSNAETTQFEANAFGPLDERNPK